MEIQLYSIFLCRPPMFQFGLNVGVTQFLGFFARYLDVNLQPIAVALCVEQLYQFSPNHGQSLLNL